jgi:hypothetical protein
VLVIARHANIENPRLGVRAHHVDEDLKYLPPDAKGEA